MTTPTAPPPNVDPKDALPRLDRHKTKCAPVRKSKAGPWRAGVLIAVHLLIGIHVLHWLVSGTTVTPVEPSEAGYLLDAGKLNAGVVLFLVLILGTLVFGRWFCGWACHLVALQDLCAWLLGRFGLRPRPVRSRLLLLVPFAVAFDMFFAGPLERLLRGIEFPKVEAAFTTTELWERFPGPLMATATVLIAGFLIVWWLGAKGFCTYGCPYGAFFGVADRFAPGRIKVTDACDACGHCTHVCTSNVRVHEEVAKYGKIVDPGCMKCMDCVSVCPKDALYYGMARPRPFAVSQQRIRARADFTWPEEIVLGVAALLAVFAFRGAWFGDTVPFLLAVAIGVITAVLVLLGWRLLRRSDLSFQRTALKHGGRWTRLGVLTFVGIAAWLGLAVHSGCVRYHCWRAERLRPAIAGRDQRDQRVADLRAYDAQLLAAQRLEFWPDPDTRFKRGLALRELAMGLEDENLLKDSEVQLRAAIATAPDFAGALIALADVLSVRGQMLEAEPFVRRAAALLPNDPGVQQRLQAIERLHGR